MYIIGLFSAPPDVTCGWKPASRALIGHAATLLLHYHLQAYNALFRLFRYIDAIIFLIAYLPNLFNA